MQLQLLQQQLAQGAMLPGLSAALAAATAAAPTVASSGNAGTHAIAGAPQCPNPTSPVTSASIGPTVSSIRNSGPLLDLLLSLIAHNTLFICLERYQLQLVKDNQLFAVYLT